MFGFTRGFQNKERNETYNKKSCSQHGSAPFTAAVLDLTFCIFSVTKVLSWDAICRRKVGKKCINKSSYVEVIIALLMIFNSISWKYINLHDKHSPCSPVNEARLTAKIKNIVYVREWRREKENMDYILYLFIHRGSSTEAVEAAATT